MSRVPVALLAVVVATCVRAPVPAPRPVADEPAPPAPAVVLDPTFEPGVLAVVAARPSREGGVDVHPTITFDRPMVALGAITREEQLPAPATIEPPVKGTWRWLGSSSVELVPDAPLPRGTMFRLTVPAGARSLDGSTLPAPVTVAFHTPVPRLESTTPESGFRWLGPEPTFELSWSAPVTGLAERLELVVTDATGRRPVGLRAVSDEGVLDAKRARGERIWPWERDDTTHVYRFAPVLPLPTDAEVRLTVKAGVHSPEGPLATLSDDVKVMRTYGPLRVVSARGCWDPTWGACTSGPVVLTTSNTVDLASLKEHLHVDPPVAIDWEGARAGEPSTWSRRDPETELPGAWKPGTTYTIQVDAGLRDAYGQASTAPFTTRITMRDLRPSVGVPEPVLLEAGGDARMPVTVANVRTVDVEVWPVDVAAMARLASAGDAERALPTTRPKEVLLLGAARNVRKAVPLDVRKALGTRTGLFVARVRSKDLPRDEHGHPWTDVVRGQVTDLAVHAKLGPESGLAWVTSLASGRPVAGAKVDLLDGTGKIRWSGRTDADGLARVPGLSGLLALPASEDRWRDDPPFALVAAEKDGDVGVTLSTWSGELDPWSFGLWKDWEGKPPSALGTVFTERGIYRPGDEVKLTGVVRTRSLGRTGTPPTGTTVTVLVTGPDGEKVFSGERKTSAFGTFDAPIPLPAEGRLGRHGVTASAVIDGQELTWDTSFRVEQYKAPPFRVDLVAPATDVVAGEPLRADVLARYLFGAPMADAPVRWTATRHRSFVQLDGARGFTVGDQASWWDDGDDAWGHEGLVSSGELRSDRLGAVRVDAGPAEAPVGGTWDVTIEAEAEDVSRQRSAGRVAVTVHSASVYAGVRLADEGFPRKGKAARVELVAVGLDGRRVAGVPLALEVTRRTWSSIRTVDPGGGFHTETTAKDEPVTACAVTSAAEPVACTFTPPEAGLYRLAVTATDAAGRKQVSRDLVWVAGDGWVAWDRDDTDHVELVADRKSYDVGDVAHVLVKSPWPEAEAVVTVEREGVLSARRVHLSGSAATLDVPLVEAHVPNVFVGVVLVRGRVGDDVGGEAGVDPGRPAFRVGYVELPVELATKRLDVAVTPSVKEARPGQQVPVDLRVTDHAGAPVRAEVTVWAVDEAVLRLTAYQRPDLVAALHPPHGLSVTTAEPLLMLTRFVETVGKGEDGGGGGDDPFASGVRKDFRTTPLFTKVVTEADGRARVTLPLPDDLTTFRIMAVAIDAGDRAGGGEAEVEVKKPLLALASLPRVLRVGDRAEIGVVVHAPALKPRKVVVTAKAGSLALLAGAQRTVSLAAGAPVEVLFPVEATKEGPTRLAFAVEAGDEHDAFEVPFDVELPVEVEAVATYGETASQALEGLVPPPGVRLDTGGLEVTLASTLLGGLGESMGQLLAYPYGCAEQQSSRLVPLVALRRLQKRFGVQDDVDDVLRAAAGARALGEAGDADPEAVVRASIRKLQAMQRPDGGYAYWEDQACTSPWVAPWVFLALTEARRAGYDVDADGLARAERYLADHVVAGRPLGDCSGGYRFAATDGLRTEALWALARAGTPRASWYDGLFARRATLPVEVRALLADAMARGGGKPDDARLLLKELLDRAEETPAGLMLREGGWSPWSSDVRATALALQALVATNPEHPYVGKLTRSILASRRSDGTYRTTQDAAFALLALTEVTERKEVAVPDFVATVRLGDRALAEEGFHGRDLVVRRADLPMAEVARLGTAQLPLTFAKTGAGTLQYTALLRYAPAEPPRDPLDRGIAVQRWVEPWSGTGQVHAVAAGDLVTVRVRVATSRVRHLVAVDVPLPAGLEIVDTSLATTTHQLVGASATDDEGEGEDDGYEAYDEGYDDADAWWSPFDHVERRDARLLLFSDELPPGVWETSVIARATTPGDFVLPSAHASEMYAPEVFGRSDGGRFQVVARAEVSRR